MSTGWGEDAEEERELWFTPGHHAFYLVPRSAVLPEGSTVIRAVRGGRRRTVEEQMISEYRIPGDEAVAWVREDLQRAVGSVRETLSRLASATVDKGREVGADLREDAGQAEHRLGGAIRGLSGRMSGVVRSPEVARALDELGDRLKGMAEELRSPSDADDEP